MELTFKVDIEVKETGGQKSDIPWSLHGDLEGEVSLEQFLEFTKKALIEISKEALQEEQAKGFDKNPVTIVDNVINKSIEDVNPLGKITFVSTDVLSLKVVEDIYTDIQRRSKYLSGTYVEGNFVIYGKQIVAWDISSLGKWIKTNPEIKAGTEIKFVNVVPYARKLERHGVTAQGQQSRKTKSRDKQKRSGDKILAPNGVYYLASRSALKNFKGNLQIYFGFILGSTLGIQGIPTISKSGKTLRQTYKSTNAKGKPQKSGPYLYPYIKLIFNERGTSS